MKPLVSKKYLKVKLYNNKVYENLYIHRLVAENFIPNFSQKPDINHIDGNKQNNTIKNLEWVTKKENTQHALKNKLLNLSIPVCQYTKEGKFIKKWNSIKEAQLELGISSHIVCCCKKKRKTAGGFVWKYGKGDD